MNPKMNFDSLKPYLLPIIALAVLVVLTPLIILPWFGDVQTGWASMGTQQTKLSALQTKADALDKVDGDQQKKTLQDEVEPAMPSQADPAGALGTIEQLANASGVQPKGAKYGQSSSGTAAATAPGAATTGGAVPVTVSLNGNYAGILNFITQSETTARVLSISTLHIVPGATGDQLVATIDVVAPYQPMLTDLGPAEEPLPTLTSAKAKILTDTSKLHPASYAATPVDSISGRQSPF